MIVNIDLLWRECNLIFKTMNVKSHFRVSASKLKDILKKIEETVCIIVSKIYVHFTRTYRDTAKLTQKLKYTCEHILF
jgi:hypothetical protein